VLRTLTYNTLFSFLYKRHAGRGWQIWLVLAVLCAGCGSGGSPSAVQAPTPAAYRTLKPAYVSSRSETVSGLFLDLKGFYCTAGPFLRNLTIATQVTGPSSAYDVGTAQIIGNYLQLLAVHAQESSDSGLVEEWLPPQPPAALQWVAGGTHCTGIVAITNTRSTSVGVRGFGFQLTAPTLSNTNVYRSVSLKGWCTGCGGGPECTYYATVTLQERQAGASFVSPVSSSKPGSCTVPVIIAPQSLIELRVTLQDAQGRDLIYTGMPALEMVDEPAISLPAFATSLTLTHTNAFPCYQFQRKAFERCSVA
jgi:hypothetical protein